MYKNNKQFEDKRGVLFLVRGFPGSGKTSFSHYIKAIAYVEADDYFINSEGKYEFDFTKISKAHDYCYNRVKYHLQKGMGDIVVSNVSAKEREVKMYKALANTYNYAFISVIVENYHNGKSIHKVSTEYLKKIEKIFSIKL
jgi:hypothetical protein